ncbi:MAG: biotin/lipoyl-containing protein, partial [Gemmatimonadota bacterium]
MSKVDVIMPQMGESIAEGTLTRWLKEPGDPVERDEDLFEISTDKVDADIPAPESGVLDEILVEEGETVEVDTVVARIETEAGAAEAEAEDGGEPSEEETAEEAAAEAGAEPEAAEADGEEAEPAAAGAEDGEPEVLSREERLQTRSTPLVRKIAAEHDVDISAVEGSGIAGRVTRDDIMAYIEEREEAPAEEERPAAEHPAAEP